MVLGDASISVTDRAKASFEISLIVGSKNGNATGSFIISLTNASLTAHKTHWVNWLKVQTLLASGCQIHVLQGTNKSLCSRGYNFTQGNRAHLNFKGCRRCCMGCSRGQAENA